MILEPSAGTGALSEAYKDVHKIWSSDSFNPHCVEINLQCVAFIKGNDIRSFGTTSYLQLLNAL